MNSIVKMFLFLAVFSLSGSLVAAQKNSKTYADGELLVKFRSGFYAESAFEANERVGAKVLENFPALRWQKVKLPVGLSVERAAAKYKKIAGVEAVQPNFHYRLQTAPNDARFSELYGLQKISAPAAWKLSVGSRSTIVAVIDTGIKYSHEDLAANMWTNDGEIAGNGIDDDGNGFIDDFYGYDFFFNDPDPNDEHGHGTHVAGTIGAVGNNNLGVVGVNWNVRLMAIKIYDRTGLGTTSAMLVNAYNYVRTMKQRGVNIRVTNNSYAGCDEACGYDQATKDALDALGEAGVLNVFAAGNDGFDVDAAPVYPASYTSPSILSVAASTASDDKAGFSNFGATSVDLAAPGTGILSTVIGENKYGFLNGTSMAAPHAAGAAALLSSYDPTLSAQSLKASLMNAADSLAQWNGKVKTGGRLNAERALRERTVCRLELSTDRIEILSAGGDRFVGVTAPVNCDYSIKSDVPWIVVTSADNGSGGSQISFSVQPDEIANRQRSGSIRIGERFLTVVQGANSAAAAAALDFDGDGKTDFSAVENASGMLWHNLRSRDGYAAAAFGLFSEDEPVPADFDGDGKADLAVWRDSARTFFVLSSRENTFQAMQFGLPGDDPRLVQDFDGDRKADFAVVRRSSGYLFWYVLGSTNGFSGFQFGLESDVPVRGDFDGDGKADAAVFRPSSGTWYVLKSSGGFQAVSFGIASDRLVPADYDGDSKTDIAVFRPSTGVWHVLSSGDASYQAMQFGQNGDLPVPGDYDGDGRSDFAVWRPNQNADASGVFYVFSNTGGFRAVSWGNSNMKISGNTFLSR